MAHQPPDVVRFRAQARAEIEALVRRWYGRGIAHQNILDTLEAAAKRVVEDRERMVREERAREKVDAERS